MSISGDLQHAAHRNNKQKEKRVIHELQPNPTIYMVSSEGTSGWMNKSSCINNSLDELKFINGSWDFKIN